MKTFLFIACTIIIIGSVIVAILFPLYFAVGVGGFLVFSLFIIFVEMIATRRIREKGEAGEIFTNYEKEL